MRREKLYLEDIIEAANAIASFVQGQTVESFESSNVLESAVAYQLMIIGEAVSRLSDDLKKRYPETPWGDIAGLRNQAVHNYFGLIWDQIWDTATEEVPALRAQVQEILEREVPA